MPVIGSFTSCVYRGQRIARCSRGQHLWRLPNRLMAQRAATHSASGENQPRLQDGSVEPAGCSDQLLDSTPAVGGSRTGTVDTERD
jgi:hypothetical protein